MDEEDKYNLVIGLIFIFNLLLGTGVLAIPHVFQKVGYLVGSTIIAALAAVSYFTVTCLLEAMANANFIKRFQALVHSSSSSSSSSTFEEEISIVDKDNEGAKKQKKKKGCRVRKVSGSFVNAAFQASSCDGELTDLFLPRLLSKFFFLSIAVYLFGDLLIFNVMMAKSARELLCTAPRPAQCNLTHWAAATLNEDEKEEMFQSLLSGDTLQEDLLPCWVSSAPAGLTRGGVYQLSLLAFVALLLPLTFAGLKKTTLLQVATIVLRWLAFISMVGLAVRTIVLDGGPRGHPAAIDMPFVPTMFGVCVYGFMAHHSVPSILTAVREKRRLFGGLQLVYLLVVGCYLLISLTGAFALPTSRTSTRSTLPPMSETSGGNVSAVTTTTRKTPPPPHRPSLPSSCPSIPVFTMFGNYTMIALTLISNLKVVVGGAVWPCSRISTSSEEEEEGIFSRIAFLLVAMLPPLAIALFTDNVAWLMGFVGSYAGGLIQYLFPCLLVYASRRKVQRAMSAYLKTSTSSKKEAELVADDDDDQLKRKQKEEEEVKKRYRLLNPFASPLQSTVWILLVVGWWLITVVLVTVDHALAAKKA
ncbi:hypothetical protein TYRP_000770 [Tyrophagus putrescentiae]|nr:hypothetical protein TYRP_000770 [Tyrophagus putrescentiae]